MSFHLTIQTAEDRAQTDRHHGSSDEGRTSS